MFLDIIALGKCAVPYIAYDQPIYKVDTWGCIFGASAMVRTNLIAVHKVMHFTKYQGSRPCVFRQEDILIFPYFCPRGRI